LIPTSTPQESPQLIKGLTLPGAIALNTIDMIGVGPFITIPLIVSAMGGPQAMLGWILGALLAMCDGLVWAELGAAFPSSGGTYKYLRETYGRNRLGRVMSFFFIWQMIFSAPLSIASGCIGLAEYATYYFPNLSEALVTIGIPIPGFSHATISVNGFSFIAVFACLTAILLLYRKITIIDRLLRYLWIIVMGTIVWVIFTGVTHFNNSIAFAFPVNAFSFSENFFSGLGSATLISVYDYWGYYNVCFLGEELKEPEKTIPRAIITSILLVAVIYIVMNISILGVIPWQELANGTKDSHFIVSAMMERIHGKWAGTLASLLIMLTAFASVFSLLLGYSRVPYAAAIDGNFFRVFARIHEKYRFPYISLLTLGFMAAGFCFLNLAEVIAALVVIRIIIQFLSQTFGVLIWHWKYPESPRPFRMWLYPVPAIISIAGFLFVLFSRKNFTNEIDYALIIISAGLIVYFIRAFINHEWPFANVSI
jgi:APA family basic amino acid/polyamine antiporter